MNPRFIDMMSSDTTGYMILGLYIFCFIGLWLTRPSDDICYIKRVKWYKKKAKWMD